MSAGRASSIRALERGIEVLRLLAVHEGSSLSALHGATGLPKPTLLRILHTLEGGGLAWRSIDDGQWRRSVAWAAAPDESAIDPRLVEAAAPHLVALQRIVLWPSDLLVYRDFAMEVAESSRRLSGLALNPRYRIGYRVDALLSAPGRAWLAFCDPAEREAVLAHWRAEVPANPRTAAVLAGEIDAILAETRRCGYAVRDPLFGGSFEDIARFDDGFDAIAVPILAAGSVRGAINLVWPRRYDLRAKVVDAHLDDLQACAAAIARALAP
jgi:IclR family mhp operon transcriptional activator